MDQALPRPFIGRAVFLDKSGSHAIGRKAYALLILDADGQIIARPFMSQSLIEVVDYVLREKKATTLARVTFDPPAGVDSGRNSRRPRKYEALELQEIYVASSRLRQS